MYRTPSPTASGNEHVDGAIEEGLIMAGDVLSALKKRVLVCDGAMGTMLYEKGFTMTRCFDELNLSHPDVVGSVHDAYLEAGADILETNTYGANRFKLAPHGLVDRVAEINRRGVEITRRAVDRVSRYRQVFVAGAVGPPGRPLEDRVYLTMDMVRDVFREQVSTLVDAGVDLVIMETLSNLEEARAAVLAARDVSDTIPVVVLITFTEEGQTVHGNSPEQAVSALEAVGASVLGANCSVGPHDILPIIQRMRKCTAMPLAVMPNAGTPRMVEGRYFYITSPEYMANYAKQFIQTAGVSLVGGCCGSTPEHIRAVRAAVRSLRPDESVELPSVSVSETPEEQKVEATPTVEKSPLARKMHESFAVSVEIRPPRGTGIQKVLDGARMLKEEGVDAVNLPDGSLASARVSPLPLARIIEDEIGLETIVHWCCRDRNLLGMQSDLLGAYLLGQRNILAITGDPPKLGDYPNATAVFDVDSVGLVRMLTRLNHGQDLIGKSIGRPTSFHVGVGVDPAAQNLEEEISRFHRKVEAGAEFVMTQPVFDIDQLRAFLEAIGGPAPPIMVGVLPLTSFRNAEIYRNEVPGMHISDAILDRMRGAGDGESAKAEGLRIAQEALLASKELDGVRGVYLMPQFGKYRTAIKVLEVLR